MNTTFEKELVERAAYGIEHGEVDVDLPGLFSLEGFESALFSVSLRRGYLRPARMLIDRGIPPGSGVYPAILGDNPDSLRMLFDNMRDIPYDLMKKWSLTAFRNESVNALAFLMENGMTKEMFDEGVPSLFERNALRRSRSEECLSLCLRYIDDEAMPSCLANSCRGHPALPRLLETASPDAVSSGVRRAIRKGAGASFRTLLSASEGWDGQEDLPLFSLENDPDGVCSSIMMSASRTFADSVCGLMKTGAVVMSAKTRSCVEEILLTMRRQDKDAIRDGVFGLSG